MGLIRRFSRDASGNVAAIFAVALVPVLAMAGTALDYSRAFNARSSLQTAVDSAVIAAVVANVPTVAEREGIGRGLLRGNAMGGHPVRIEKIDVSAKRVLIRATARVTPFVFGAVARMTGESPDDIVVGAQATAARVYGGPPPCVLALNPTASGAITITGDAAFTGEGCVLHSNSTGSGAVTVGGHATVKAAGVCAAGTVSATRPLSPQPQPYCEPMDDPFRALPRPTDTSCRHRDVSVKPQETATLEPGVYCGGLRLKGTVTLQPGTYVVRDGALDITGQATVTGTGVTFYLVGAGAGFDLNGGGGSKLTAPTTGDYAGLLVIQDRDANPGATSKMNGNASATLQGAIYAPTQHVKIGGNAEVGQQGTNGGAGATAAAAFAPIVADRVTLSGSARLSIEVASVTPARPLPRSMSGARLFE